MAIYRYQTLTLGIHVNKSALTDISEVVVSIMQGNKVFHYSYSADQVTIDIANGTLTVELTQENTSAFSADTTCYAQVNVMCTNGERLVSDIVPIDNVKDNLYKKVIGND